MVSMNLAPTWVLGKVKNLKKNTKWLFAVKTHRMRMLAHYGVVQLCTSHPWNLRNRKLKSQTLMKFNLRTVDLKRRWRISRQVWVITMTFTVSLISIVRKKMNIIKLRGKSSLKNILRYGGIMRKMLILMIRIRSRKLVRYRMNRERKNMEFSIEGVIGRYKIFLEYFLMDLWIY